jgi:SAM-dependent methyltransferase
MISFTKKLIKKIVPYYIWSTILDKCRYVASLKYLGNKYECPFCERSYSMLLPDGFDFPVLKEKQVISGIRRLHSKCPRCRSDHRERLIYLFLYKVKQEIFSRNIKLLHVAPEKNLALKLKSCPNIDYLSIDLDSPLADLKMDITDIKLDNDTFDIIICNHVLEHIPDDEKTMRELYRVLKQGGFAILQVPISYSIEATLEDSTIINPKEREIVFGQWNHVRIYGKDYILRLEKAGFTVNICDYSKEIGSNQDVLKYELDKDEKIFLCSK